MQYLDVLLNSDYLIQWSRDSRATRNLKGKRITSVSINKSKCRCKKNISRNVWESYVTIIFILFSSIRQSRNHLL